MHVELYDIQCQLDKTASYQLRTVPRCNNRPSWNLFDINKARIIATAVVYSWYYPITRGDVLELLRKEGFQDVA